MIACLAETTTCVVAKPLVNYKSMEPRLNCKSRNVFLKKKLVASHATTVTIRELEIYFVDTISL